MFELKTAKAKVTNVEVLSHKNREADANPGAKLSFECKVPNHVVAMLHPLLLPMLWRAQEDAPAPPQAALDGIPDAAELPNLTQVGAHVPTLPWEDELSGYTLRMAYGVRGRSDDVINDCKVYGFRVKPHEGGTATVKFKVESLNIGEPLWGRLAKKKGLEFEIDLVPPVVAQIGIEDSDGDDDAPDPAPAAPARATGPAPSQRTRTARGRAQTQAALASGGKPIAPPAASGTNWPFPKETPPTHDGAERAPDATDAFVRAQQGSAQSAT